MVSEVNVVKILKFSQIPVITLVRRIRCNPRFHLLYIDATDIDNKICPYFLDGRYKIGLKVLSQITMQVF